MVKELSCHCLNVVLNVESLDREVTLASEEEKLLQAIFTDKVEFGTAPTAKVCHSTLTSARTLCEGKWNAVRCENCKLNCYAIDETSSNVAISPSLYRGAQVNRLRSDPCFSQAFQVIVRTSGPQMHKPREPTYSKSLESYADTLIEKEQLTMEQRIHKFVQEQQLEFQHFKDHMTNELRVLSRASQDNYDTKPSSHVESNSKSNYPSPFGNSESGWSSEGSGNRSPADYNPSDGDEVEDDDDNDDDIFQLDEDNSKKRPKRRTDSDASEGSDVQDLNEMFGRMPVTGKSNKFDLLSSSVPLAIPRAQMPREPRELHSGSSSPEDSFMPPHTIADFDFYNARRGSRDDTRHFERAVLHQSLSLRSRTNI